MHRKPTWQVEVSTGCGIAGGGPIAPAIVRRTEVRAALEHLARDPDLAAALGRNCASSCPPRGLAGHTAGFWRSPRGAGGTSPWSTPRRCRSCPAARSRSAETRPPATCLRSRRYGVLPRKLALPGVGHMPASGLEVVAPGVLRAIQTAAGGELPLRFGRQFLARPLRVRVHVRPGDVHGGVVLGRGAPSSPALRMPHVRPRHGNATSCTRSRSPHGAAADEHLEPATIRRAAPPDNLRLAAGSRLTSRAGRGERSARSQGL